MEKKRFLLVLPPIPGYEAREEFCMPIGPAYINGALRNAGFQVDGINLLFEDGDPWEALRKKICDWEPDVLLCGGLTSEYQMLKRVFQVARETRKELILVGGGGGFTAEPVLFSEMTGVDYAVIGEGEDTECELAAALEQGLDVSGIQGLVYKNQAGHYIKNPDRPNIRDLDRIPFPSYEGLGMEKYLAEQNVEGWYNYYTYYSDELRLMPMLTSRSCPYQCSFCFHPMGKGYRFRSLDNFFEELDLWIEKYQINGVALLDECFSIDRKRVLEFCRRIKPYHIAWACQMRAETYTDEVIRAMKDSGCIGACFGIESMSVSVLENMQKHLTKEAIEHALKMTYKYRIGCSGNLIFGAETENLETMKESLGWCETHTRENHTQPIRNFGYIQTYPGSRYYDHAVANGKIPDKRAYIEAGKWNLNITGETDACYELMGDIARLKFHETINRGEVIRVEEQENPEYMKLTVRCSYCGEETTYGNIRKKRLRKGRLRRLGCRNCHILSDYVFDDARYRVERYKTVPWALGEWDPGDLDGYLEKKGYSGIGIIGKNSFARLFVEKLKEGRVVYWIDRKEADSMLPKADAWIIADIVHMADIKERIADSAKVILSLEEILEGAGKFYDG